MVVDLYLAKIICATLVAILITLIIFDDKKQRKNDEEISKHIAELNELLAKFHAMAHSQTSNEPVEIKVIENIEQLLIERDRMSFNYSLGMRGKNRTEVVKLSEDFFYLSDYKIEQELYKILRKHDFIPLAPVINEFLERTLPLVKVEVRQSSPRATRYKYEDPKL